MGTYIMIEASAPPDAFQESAKVAIETQVKYPDYIKKVLDIGGNFVNYAIYQVNDAKVADAMKVICARYMKIAAVVPGYNFVAEVLLDSADWMAAIK